MSADSDKNAACPSASFKCSGDDAESLVLSEEATDDSEKKKVAKSPRKVCFPDEAHIVTQYFEPADPWHDLPPTTRAQLATDYLESCRRHGTPPIDSVLQQIQDLADGVIGGSTRAPRLTLACCSLLGAAPCDALEAVLHRVQFRRLELECVDIDDEGAEALFDMVEYYESATVVSISGPRHFGIRGWQAASRMIKKSAELSELEISDGAVEGAHTPVLARALRPHTCRLRSLSLQRASLAGDPLLCLVIALKCNRSVRELRLCDNRLTAADAAQLGALLRLNTRVQLLDLSNNQIQDAGAGHIADALVEQAAQTPPSPGSSPLSPHHCPIAGGYESRGLAFLVLWNNQLTRNCVHNLVRMVRASKSLCVLNIGRNALGSAAVRVIGAGGLLSLGLQGARLAPDAAPPLRAALASAPAQRIDLRDNRLGVEGLQAILAALATNTAVTQIDLDDPTESSRLSEDSEAATIARLTREIRAACRRNEPAAATQRRMTRKISLTCHTTCLHRGAPAEEERRPAAGRLRSPAPSPAASPTPAPASRFSVTRVTPERAAERPFSAPSRFKVVQVSEPPQIQVESATPEQPRRCASRFSVTRNTDTMYNPAHAPAPPPTPIARPRGPVNSDNSDNSDNREVYSDKSEALSHDEAVSVVGATQVTNTETKLVKTSTAVSDNERVEVDVCVTVKKETVSPAVSPEQEKTERNDEKSVEKRDDVAMKQIEAITEDLGNLIQEMRDRSKTVKAVKVKSDCTQTDVNVDSKLDAFDDVPVINRDNVVLKKNKSESSLDSPDLEVSRLMNKKLTNSPFCDSSSSLEISGSSMESLNALDSQNTKPIIIQESVESDSELDRRKSDVVLSTESSIESTSEVTPVNSGNLLNMSVSSNESVSPIIFGKNKKIHGSLSSLEASVSSLESKQEKVMVTSADSGIEYSLQAPSENKEDNSSNEGTLTNNSSLKETVKKDGLQMQETLTCSPKRTSSLLDVPALRNKGLDRMRKISWVAPSASFHIPRPEPEKESKMPGHLEKLLSLFQHPSSIFSRSSEDEKKCASNTPPRKDSSLASSFWTWGSATEKSEDREDRDSLSEATDSTLSERVQVSFVDESFSKKLDSKTPSTDTDNTLSEFQSFPQGNSESEEVERVKVTEITTDDNLVQKCIGLSLKSDASANGNKDVARASDTVDLKKPNDLNKNYDIKPAGDNNKNPGQEAEAKVDLKEEKIEPVRPRSFAAVLKASSSENSLEKQSPETGQPVDKLSSKVIRGIKENISPENTLTSSMTKALAFEVTEKQVKNQPIVNTVWEVTLDNEPIKEDVKVQSELAPIATIEETCDETLENQPLEFIDDIKFIDEKNTSSDSGVTLEGTTKVTRQLAHVDLGKDALSYLNYENQDFEPGAEVAVKTQTEPGSLAQELRDAEIKEQLLDLSPELVVDDAVEVPEVFAKETSLKTSPVIPERAKLKKANSLEDISQSDGEGKKTIAFKVPEIISTPRDIPERRTKLRSRSGSSPKSLPESLNKPSPLTKMDLILSKKKKKVSSLGKIARDSLLALNMSEEEIAEFRRSYKLTSVESLRSLESVSEDANSQSGNSVDSRCRSCFRMSQESLMSLDSINEDCKCEVDSDRPSQSGR